MTGTLKIKSIGIVVSIVALTALSACTADDTAGNSGNKTTTGVGAQHSSKPNKPKYTVAQENAIKSAQEYLSLGSGFSRAGLISQLSAKTGEGFKMADAVFAVDHIKVDYNQQAVLSAKGYLKLSGFSRAGLIDQLTSKAGEQYTVKQATYAADKVGL